MGRLPEFFAGTNKVPQRITFRSPYTMGDVINVPSSSAGAQFAPDVFTHSVDRPFEIHRAIPRAYSVNSSGIIIVPQPPLELILGCINQSIQDYGKQARFQKASTPIMTSVKGTSEVTWEWAEPYYLEKDEGLITALDSLVYPFTNSTVRVAWAYQGFLLTLAPASERRGGS